MYLINYCLSASNNISNISNTLFYVPIKINETTANSYSYY